MFTEKVQALADEKGIKINQLLKETGIGAGTFSTWKKRGTIPSGEVLAKIANYFGVTVDYLLGEDQEHKTVSEEMTEEEKKMHQLFQSVPKENQKELLDLIETALKMSGLTKKEK